MLYQIGLPNAFVTGILNQFSDHIQLVVARKIECFLAQWISFFAIKADKMLDDIGLL